MRYMLFTGMWCGTPGAGRDLGIRSRTEREVRAVKSSGGRHMKATSRWSDALRLGDLGGISGYNRDIGKSQNGERCGGR